MDDDGDFLCKKQSKVYSSRNDIDKMLTYRNYIKAEQMKNDQHYWNHRNINIDNFSIVKIELSFKKK